MAAIHLKFRLDRTGMCVSLEISKETFARIDGYYMVLGWYPVLVLIIDVLALLVHLGKPNTCSVVSCFFVSSGCHHTRDHNKIPFCHCCYFI